jgi:hypothetical protein
MSTCYQGVGLVNDNILPYLRNFHSKYSAVQSDRKLIDLNNQYGPLCR